LPPSSIARNADRLLRGTIECLGTGFGFTEGPVWDARTQSLVFSDIAQDTLRGWRADQGFTVVRQPSNKANGSARDAQGRLVSCEHATSRVVRQEADGAITVLASHFDGKELNSPNDVVVAADGAIYFTDPTYGRIRADLGVVRDLQQPVRGVYRIAVDGGLTRVADDFEQPNGLCFSDDGRVLYVNDTARKHIRRFDVLDGGALGGGEVWADVGGEGPGVPDGMKMGADGTLLCTGPGGIQVFRQGTSVGVIPVPEKVTNFCWGGDQLDKVFVTATTSVFVVSPG